MKKNVKSTEKKNTEKKFNSLREEQFISMDAIEMRYEDEVDAHLYVDEFASRMGMMAFDY